MNISSVVLSLFETPEHVHFHFQTEAEGSLTTASLWHRLAFAVTCLSLKFPTFAPPFHSLIHQHVLDAPLKPLTGLRRARLRQQAQTHGHQRQTPAAVQDHSDSL